MTAPELHLLSRVGASHRPRTEPTGAVEARRRGVSVIQPRAWRMAVVRPISLADLEMSRPVAALPTSSQD